MKARLTSESFEFVVDAIYSAAEDPSRWETLLAVLTDHLGGVGAGLHAGDRDGTAFSFGATYKVDPEGLAEYARYYYSINPLNFALSSVPVGVAIPDHKLISPREMERTEVYNDYMRRIDTRGSITLVLARDSRHEACLGVLRRFRSDSFSDEQVSFVQLLAKHLKRSIDLNRRLAGVQTERATLETALGGMETAVFVLDHVGAILYSNAAGEKLLEKRDGLRVSQRRLSSDVSSAQNSLAHLLQSALRTTGACGGSVAVPRQFSARPLLAKVMPVARKNGFWLDSTAARAVVFVTDPDSQPEGFEEVMDVYGLTSSEKRLLNELIAGRSLRDAADSLKITHVTSRNRLARIMAKTDTHRQSELLQLILRSRTSGNSTWSGADLGKS